MAALSDLGTRLRGALRGAAGSVGRSTRRATQGVAVAIEGRPPLELPEVEFPYRFPTRGEPLALVLFWTVALSIAAVSTLVPLTVLLYGRAPPSLIYALGVSAMVVGAVANLNLFGRALRKEATQLLRPIVDAGVPVLDVLHFWLSPLLVVLVLAFALVRSSNNYLMVVVAAVLASWAVSGLLVKLPRDSPWNGPMLQRWAGRLHRTPFVYVALLAMAFTGIAADMMY